jgi:cysteine-rich repeat protein
MTRAVVSYVASSLFLALAACGGDSGSAETTDEGSTSEGGTTTSFTSTTTMSTTTTATTDTGSESGVVDSSSSEGGPACGDGTVDDALGEECDDGNTDNGDACSADCTIPFTDGWTATYNGTDNLFDGVTELALDDSGNVYALGYTRSLATGEDLWLRQYMPDGTEGWTFTYDGQDSLDDAGASLVIHPTGDFVVVGTSESTMSGDDILVLRVAAADQSIVWENVVAGPGTDMGNDTDMADFGRDVALDSMGNVVALGRIRVDMQRWNVWLGKYDADGGELWVQTFDGAASQSDFPGGVAVDDLDNALVVLDEGISAVDYEGRVQTWSSDGMLTDTLNIAYDGDDIRIDAEGNIVIAGNDVPGNTQNDTWVVKYAPDWTELWSQTHDGPAHAGDFAAAIAFDADGNVYIAGSHTVTDQGSNAWVAKYAAADGAPVWSADYNNARANLDDFLSGVVVDGSNVIVGGAETVLGEQTNAWVRQYVQN